MTEKPSKLQPALIGGLIIGVLSVIPYLGVGCCLWGIIGGAIAAYLLIKRSPVFRVTAGDGTVVGLLAGLVGALIMVVVNVWRSLAQWGQVVEAIRQQAANASDSETQETVAKFATFMADNPVLGALLIWLIFAVIILGMALLGGVIGVAMFEKRKGQPVPPQGPPNYPPPPNFDPPNQPPY